ncbi:hypothetical protein B0H13DRAFT_2328476 [Mycena leptocephala]|nr:hypothetical protein B0H13DRAFT_2328476 [Mycena leptocephala]
MTIDSVVVARSCVHVTHSRTPMTPFRIHCGFFSRPCACASGLHRSATLASISVPPTLGFISPADDQFTLMLTGPFTATCLSTHSVHRSFTPPPTQSHPRSNSTPFALTSHTSMPSAIRLAPALHLLFTVTMSFYPHFLIHQSQFYVQAPVRILQSGVGQCAAAQVIPITLQLAACRGSIPGLEFATDSCDPFFALSFFFPLSQIRS